MEDIGNEERHGDVPEWGLEDLTDSVLYDVFYESTTMLAGRMLAQQRLTAGQGNRYREHWARMNRYGLLSDRDRVDPTDREALVMSTPGIRPRTPSAAPPRRWLRCPWA